MAETLGYSLLIGAQQLNIVTFPVGRDLNSALSFCAHSDPDGGMSSEERIELWLDGRAVRISWGCD